MAEDKEIIFNFVASFEGCSKSGGKFCFFYLNAKDGLSGVSINLYKMKRILFQLFIFCSCATSLTAQISREQADEIVIEIATYHINYISCDTKPPTLFAKDGPLADTFTVVTSTGEKLELKYACWVYFLKYDEGSKGKYLIVKESNGNILEVNTKNDERVEDLEDWRKLLPIETPFTEYSLAGTSCQWINFESDKVIMVNDDEELQDYIVCADNDYSKIDFSEHSLLLVNGLAYGSPAEIIEIRLQQTSKNEYVLCLKIRPGLAGTPGPWNISILIPKLLQESIITLGVQQVYFYK